MCAFELAKLNMNSNYRNNRKIYLFCVVFACFFIGCSNESSLPNLKRIKTYTQGLKHPTQIVKLDNHFLLSQMHTPLPLTVDGLDSPIPNVTAAEGLKSPHFFAVSDNGFYLSDGRKSDIWFFPDNQIDRGRIISKGLGLNRPHGLCLDKFDWLYIADSVNSRLVRWHTKFHTTEVFADHQKRIAYGRQLLCREDGIWLSNSYEKSFKLNPGNGANILKITDFSSGKSKVIFADPNTNFTGIEIINNRLLLVGRWSGKFDVVQVDMSNFTLLDSLITYESNLDAPYGMYHDSAEQKLYISFLGLGKNRTKGQTGGIVEFTY